MSALHTLAIYGREARAQILSTVRTPQFVIPSVALPLLFYGVMGLGLSKGREEVAHFMLANYVIFAAIAVMPQPRLVGSPVRRGVVRSVTPLASVESVSAAWRNISSAAPMTCGWQRKQ